MFSSCRFLCLFLFSSCLFLFSSCALLGSSSRLLCSSGLLLSFCSLNFQLLGSFRCLLLLSFCFCCLIFGSNTDLLLPFLLLPTLLVRLELLLVFCNVDLVLLLELHLICGGHLLPELAANLRGLRHLQMRMRLSVLLCEEEERRHRLLRLACRPLPGSLLPTVDVLLKRLLVGSALCCIRLFVRAPLVSRHHLPVLRCGGHDVLALDLGGLPEVLEEAQPG
mmetsp:Transcript_56667/g.160874  ORF Transcript_56667/g.160874 Transcript_56667/m.160874 type:complete len:222 (+) Transcript_56667:474-1139(+)